MEYMKHLDQLLHQTNSVIKTTYNSEKFNTK